MPQEKFTIDPKTDPGLIRRNKALLRLERKRYTWVGYSLLIILVDQLTKWCVTEVVLRQSQGVNFFEWYIHPSSKLPFVGKEVFPFFNVVMVWNRGVSFGMFNSMGAFMPFILILVALFIAGLFLKWLLETKDPFQGVCHAFIIGGAIGNVIDRIRFLAVIDFLDFHAFGYHWPAFNVADMAVCIGVGLLISSSFIADYQKGRKREIKKKHIRKLIKFYKYRR